MPEKKGGPRNADDLEITFSGGCGCVFTVLSPREGEIEVSGTTPHEGPCRAGGIVRNLRERSEQYVRSEAYT